MTEFDDDLFVIQFQHFTTYFLFTIFMISIVLLFIIMLKTSFIVKTEAPRLKKEMYYKNSLKWSLNVNKIAISRRKNILQYNYDDWEGKRPDFYSYEFTPNETVISPAVTTTIAATNNLTAPVLNTTVIKGVTTTTTTILTSISTTIETDIPELPTEDIFVDTTTTTQATTPPPKNPLIDEIINTKDKMKGGYFTASMMVFLKIAITKKPAHLQPLLIGFNSVVTRLNHNHELIMFGPSAVGLVANAVYVASITAMEQLQPQIQYVIFLLEDRRNRILPDLNGIFDVIDAIYNEEDLNNIANLLKYIEDYPNTTKTPVQISEDAFAAFIFKPLGRIEGTAKERMLMLEISNVAEKRLDIIPGYERRFNKEVPVMKTNASQVILRTNKQNPIEFMNYSFVKNETIMRRLRFRMKSYKNKFKGIKMKEKGKSKRGPTTTATTTTTTTEMPPMHKSKYYIRRYVKRNLYRRTTTTKKTTEFRWKYYGKIRKFNIDSGRSCNEVNETINRCSSSIDSDSEGYYTDDRIVDDGSSEYNNNKKLKDDGITDTENRDDENNKVKLKSNLKDAIYHKQEESRKGYYRHRLEDESFSDNEPLLKSRIYKVFSYNYSLN